MGFRAVDFAEEVPQIEFVPPLARMPIDGAIAAATPKFGAAGHTASANFSAWTTSRRIRGCGLVVELVVQVAGRRLLP